MHIVKSSTSTRVLNGFEVVLHYIILKEYVYILYYYYIEVYDDSILQLLSPCLRLINLEKYRVDCVVEERFEEDRVHKT